MLNTDQTFGTELPNDPHGYPRPAAALLGLSLLAACGSNMEQRAATGAATGLVVAGPVGAAVGAGVGAAVNEVEEDKSE